jgi:hypothetical protein
VRRLCRPDGQPRPAGEVSLEAWPASDAGHPVVTFEVPRTALDELYGRHDLAKVAMRMGAAGGMVVGDLEHKVVAIRFMPALARRIVSFADTCELPDGQSLAGTDVQPTMWLMGIKLRCRRAVLLPQAACEINEVRLELDEIVRRPTRLVAGKSPVCRVR